MSKAAYELLEDNWLTSETCMFSRIYLVGHLFEITSTLVIEPDLAGVCRTKTRKLSDLTNGLGLWFGQINKSEGVGSLVWALFMKVQAA